MIGTQNSNSQRQVMDWEYDERRFERDAESAIDEAQDIIREGAKDLGSAISETFNLFTGGFDMQGSIEFQKENDPEAEKKQMEIIRKQNFIRRTEVDLDKAAAENQRKQREQQIIQINTKLHRGNVQFQGILNSDGSVNAYTESELEKANSEMSPEQVAAKRGTILAQARGASALQAATEGGSGGFEQNLETSGAGPKANLSVQAGG